ncbi:uncharacterized protein LOC142239899 [Haematobia irritans]|uniref:uncharacterized protein LOC142239899 n=1 Tax=Haematobia irritans TaxID=7368 RepID=UPI003F5043DF
MTEHPVFNKCEGLSTMSYEETARQINYSNALDIPVERTAIDLTIVSDTKMFEISSIRVLDAPYPPIPPLYVTDDYRECIEDAGAAYCMVYAEIQPNNSSEVWQQIQRSQNPTQFRYRHDILYRGICTKNIGKQVSPMKECPQSLNVEMGQMYRKFSQSQKSIGLYEHQLHRHINADFQRTYNLSVKTFVNYCDNPMEPLVKDSSYYYAIWALIIVTVLNILSTIIDAYLKPHHSKEANNFEYYDSPHENTVQKYLTSFSLYRNYRRLILPNNSAMGKDLRFLDGLRSILSFIIVFEHITLIQFLPLENTDAFEASKMSSISMAMVHLLSCIELFFVMSGLLLYLKWDKCGSISEHSSFKDCLKVYGRMMVSRYLRYMPSVLLLVLFSSNILLYLGQGPIWRYIMEPNVVMCQTKWWSNLLMTSNLEFNNYCWLHTWYIAADFQLYALMLAILIISAKYPQWKKSIYIAIGILGISLPSIFSYINKLNSVPTMSFENYRHMYVKNADTGKHIYVSPYANLNAVFVGIMCGELYTNFLRHDKYKQFVGGYLKFLPPWGWLSIAYIWYLGSKLVPLEASIWTALFPLLYKHVAVYIVTTIVILKNMSQTGGFLTWPIFRLVSRISYQIYLWHVLILHIILGIIVEPLNVTLAFTSKVFITTYIVSVMVAFIPALMIEYPFAEIFSFIELTKKLKSAKESKPALKK